MVMTLPSKTGLSLHWMGRTPPSRHSWTLRAFIWATFQHFVPVWVLLACYGIACCFLPFAVLYGAWAFACPDVPKPVPRKCCSAAERHARRHSAIVARRAAGDSRRRERRRAVSAIVSRSLSVLGLYVQIGILLCCARVLLAVTLIGFLFMRVAVWFCVGRMLLAVIRLAWCAAGEASAEPSDRGRDAEQVATRSTWEQYLSPLTLVRLSHTLFCAISAAALRHWTGTCVAAVLAYVSVWLLVLRQSPWA
jgi:hypothetical protein